MSVDDYLNSFKYRNFLTLLNLEMNTLASAKGEEEKKKHANKLFFHTKSFLQKVHQKDLPVLLMQEAIIFCRRNALSAKYLELTFFSLYKTAMASDDPVICKQAQNKLLSFFAPQSPEGLKSKKFLLAEILKKDDFVTENKVVPKILSQTIDHYIRTGQYLQDSDASVIHLSSVILNKLANEKRRTILTNPVRETLRDVVANLNKLNPEIVAPSLEKWNSSFAKFTPQHYHPTEKVLIRELAESPKAIPILRKGTLNFSRGWERES